MVDWVMSSKVEHAVATIISQQERNGVQFNLPLAIKLIDDIDIECKRIYNALRSRLSYEVINKYTVPLNKPYLKGGGYSSNVFKWYTEKGYDIPNIGGPFSRVEFSDPDMNSREKFKKQLLRLGWKPRNFTEKGNPKLTIKNEFDETVACPSLEKTLGILGEEVAKFYIIRHRQAQIKGFLRHVRPDGRIPAGAIPDGTNTHRMTHKVVANIPRVSSVLGKEMRSLFMVPEGYKMVGADLSGLELRCLAHRMNDAEYTNTLLNEDIHIFNQKAAKLSTRDQAKKFIYTFLYGGGDALVGHSIGGGAREGKKIKKQFLAALPALDRLITRVKKASKRGYLIGLDGRKIWMRAYEGKIQEHKALNTLLQCDGSLIMKVALAYMQRNILTNPNLDATLLITYHDEVQMQVREDQAELVGDIIIECFEAAGRFFEMNCPITGEYEIGDDWSTTH